MLWQSAGVCFLKKGLVMEMNSSPKRYTLCRQDVGMVLRLSVAFAIFLTVIIFFCYVMMEKWSRHRAGLLLAHQSIVATTTDYSTHSGQRRFRTSIWKADDGSCYKRIEQYEISEQTKLYSEPPIVQNELTLCSRMY